MSRVGQRAILPLSLLLTVIISVGGCDRNKDHSADEAHSPAISVDSVRVQSTVTAADAEVPGTVRPVREARLAAKLMARVKRVEVDEGDHVRRGALLIKLDDADLRAQVAQASAAVRAAQAGRDQAQTTLDMQRVASSAEVEQARAGLRMAQANLAKVRQGPRPEQVSQAREALAQAKSGLASAEAQLDMVREGARTQQRIQVQQAVTQAEQGVAAAAQQVTAAEAAARTAEADYNRMKALADQDVISGQRLDHVKLQLDGARAQLAMARAGHTQAEAGLEQARQQLSMVEEGARTQEVEQAEQSVAQARAGVEQAQLQVQMATSGGRSEDVAAAQAGVAQAEEGLRNVEAAQGRDRLREAGVTAATAGIGQASAGAQAARVMLGYATITAPFDGLITSRDIDPGSMSAPGMPLLTIEDDSSYRLEAIVPEGRLAHLHLGAVVDVVLDSLGARWPAEIVEITPAADAASHTFIAKAELPDDGRVHSGLFGRMVFSTGEREAIFVPDAAIWREGSLTGVFVINDGAVELRMIQLGASEDGVTEVNSGLEIGETIATDSSALTDGARVTVSGGEAQ